MKFVANIDPGERTPNAQAELKVSSFGSKRADQYPSAIIAELAELYELADGRHEGEFHSLVGDSRLPKSSQDRDLLKNLVQAAAGQRLPLVARLVGTADKSDPQLILGLWLLCEHLNYQLLQRIVSDYLQETGSERTLVQVVDESAVCFLSDIWRLHDSHASDLVGSEVRSFMHLQTSGRSQGLSQLLGLDEIQLGELLRILELLRVGSRYDHLAGRRQVDVCSPEVSSVIGGISAVFGEVQLRKALDWVSAGEWRLGMVCLERLAADPRLDAKDWSTVKQVGDFCRVQLRLSSENQHELGTLEEVSHSDGPMALLNLLQRAMVNGNEPMAVLDALEASFGSPGETPNPLYEAAVAIEANRNCTGPSALAELGDVADTLLEGSKFERAVGHALRVFQAHALMLRGHFKWALRVCRYVKSIESYQFAGESPFEEFLQQDLRALTSVSGGA
ncbi:hypothetical protein ACF07D_12885 [Leucobacter sp. NPDC015123]|uniref:hypothetical protein n=1 Tax=Leucobacter sp. NPDC015123 TaxID=3364129 RepID=UPI0036F486D8